MESGSARTRLGRPAVLAYRRVLLVGFMGSGKSTVGPLLASRLGWSFLDFDVEIERRAGASIAEIFRRNGEPFFRDLEAEVGRDALSMDHAVLASGGGWAVAPGHLEGVGPGTLVVWLRVRPETSVERSHRGGPERPLLEGPDAVSRARSLLEAREPWYGRARLHLDSEAASPEELVEILIEHLSSGARTGPVR